MERFILHEKVLEGNIFKIAAILPLCEDINELDDFGCSPLHWAVINMQEDVVKLLLMFRANTNTTSKQGLTPMAYAEQFGYYQIEHLLSYGIS